LTFQTILGAGRVDFIGTDEVDVLVAANVDIPAFVAGAKVMILSPLFPISLVSPAQQLFRVVKVLTPLLLALVLFQRIVVSMATRVMIHLLLRALLPIH